MNKLDTEGRGKSSPAKSAAKRRLAATGKPLAAGKLAMGTPLRVKTLRLEPMFEQGLVILKGVLHKPINKMVNEAVGEYIERRAAEVEAELTSTLEQLRAYRRADPGFSVERRAFIDAEARYGKDDPAEGRVVTVAPPPGAYASRRAAASGPASNADNPALAMVRELLRS